MVNKIQKWIYGLLLTNILLNVFDLRIPLKRNTIRYLCWYFTQKVLRRARYSCYTCSIFVDFSPIAANSHILTFIKRNLQTIHLALNLSNSSWSRYKTLLSKYLFFNLTLCCWFYNAGTKFNRIFLLLPKSLKLYIKLIYKISLDLTKA